MSNELLIALTILLIALSIIGLFFLALIRKQPAATSRHFGDYTHLKVIGNGGMATIFRAKNKLLKRTVAVKIMHSGLMKDVDLVHKFLEEGKNLAKINKEFPNSPVVKVLEYSHPKSSGPFFIAMEYLNGMNLLQVIKAGNVLQLRTKLHIIREVARALHVSHSFGIYHRDIAPDNIMIDGNDVTLIDFGIAKQEFSAYRTMQLDIVGKPFYMSPEHGAGKQIDEKTDIYSLGAVFFFLLEGRPMYDANNIVDILRMHQESPVPDITHPIPGELKSFIVQMLDKKPAARPTAYDVAAKMEAFLARGI